MFSGLLQKDLFKGGEVWRKVFSNKIIVTLVRVCRLFSSPFLLRKLTYYCF